MNDLSPIRNRLASLALLALVCNLAGSAEPAPRFTHPRDITNRYLPLGTLQRDVLESHTGRIERTAKPELRKAIRFGGQDIEALVVEDREFENGKLVEVALDYFAQADDGTVYYLGEDVNEYKDGKIVSHSGAWLLGKDTERPGILMPAHPRVGDKFRSEDVPKITWEEDKVVSVSETVTVPAGTYRDCVKIKERLSDGSIEYKYCAPGVGCVKEEEADTVFLLRSHTAHAAKASSAKAGSQANPTTLPSTAGTGSGGQNPPLQDPLAGAALSYVGADPYAEDLLVRRHQRSQPVRS